MGYTCNNCQTGFTGTEEDCLITWHGSKTATALCPACCRGVKVAKVVLRRDDAGRFSYDQFTALEMQAKAFGT